MTSSRSNSRWALVFALAAAWLVAMPRGAEAGRKRVVVLELEGPKAEKFHDDLVKLIKKTHTVIPVDKWNGTAEELDASGGSEKDVKKVAKKLKIDAVISGKVQKRRDNYILQLKLRDGRSGSLSGNSIEVKAEGPRLDGEASGQLKDELIPAIDSLKGGGGGGDDEDEDKPAKKPSKKDKDEDADADASDEDKPVKKGFSKKKETNEDSDASDEDKPAKKGFKKKELAAEDEEDKPAKKGFSKKKETNEDSEDENPLPKGKKVAKKDSDDEDKPKKKDADDEDKPKKKDADDDEDKPKKKKKKVARKDDDEGGGEEGVEEGSGDAMVGAEALTPAERAVDATLGLSLNARRMAFDYESGLGNAPKPYKGVPVAGVILDATIYPLAVGHKRKDILKNIGLTVMYDKVIKISSKQGGATLPTSEGRYAFGAAFRYPLGKALVGATLRYGRQNFTIGSAGGVMSDLPNVNYTIVDPALFVKYSLSDKITADASISYMAILGTGAIQKTDAYGAAHVTAYELELGGDYMLTKNIFARAAVKYEAIGYKFKGTGMLTTGRDQDPDPDVFGAKDKYIGGTVNVGYVY